MPWPHIRATALALRHHLSVCIILYIRQQLVRVQWLIFESCRSDSWTLLEPFWVCAGTLWPQGLTPSAHLKFHFSLPDGDHMPILSKFNCFSFQSLLCSCNAWRDRSSPNSLIPPPPPPISSGHKKRTYVFFRIILWNLLGCDGYLSAASRRNHLRPEDLPRALLQRLRIVCSAVLAIWPFSACKTTKLAPLQLRGRNWFPITFSFLLSSCTLFWLDSSYARGCPGKSNWELSGFGFWIDCRCRRGFAAKIQRKLLWYSFRFFGNLKAAVISYWKNLCSV